MEQKRITSTEFLEEYLQFKNQNLIGRYIQFNTIEDEIQKLKSKTKIKVEGSSVLNHPIYSVSLGDGPIKILAWSQMHGNETTTTKAVFDVLNFLTNKCGVASNILAQCSIKILPVLNPDGAIAYTRENANGIDLNRDAFKLQEPESKILRTIFNNYQPHFCINLHDQRTIFSAGETNKPASLSFLAPACNLERSITLERKRAMQLIAAIFNEISLVLEGKIGRYDDAFNKNCAGDTFMSLKVPTMLFEAGHFPKDYMREETRKFMTLAIFMALQHIATQDYKRMNFEDYFAIPDNRKLFLDVIIRDVKIGGKLKDVGIQFKEVLKNNKVEFVPIVQEIKQKIAKMGHREIKANGKEAFVDKEKIHENLILNEIRIGADIFLIKSA